MCGLLYYHIFLRDNKKGTYVVRMEDIDLQRSKRELGEALLDDLEWLGFEWDEGPRIGGPESTYWQSERQEYYANILDSLALEKLIYPCFCNRARLQSIASAPSCGRGGFIDMMDIVAI